ncbi:MAG: glycoside hydrolase family 25 protein [Lachnospiraceae bacterium]|nr:glycoside hydrolase family 25 protein [Lachnospiraceae bacterium]
MERRVRNLAILAAVSVLFLMLLLVGYANKQGKKKTPAPTGTGETSVADPYRAFLNDPHFFDGDEEIVEAPTTTVAEEKPRLNMLLGSVARDIRVSVVDAEGRPVRGKAFYVQVDPLGEYKDLDQDGQIYIPDVEPGEYFVKLKRVEGYECPTDPMPVSVKAELEFKPIGDIAVYIRSEEEVDPAAEDLRQSSAAQDADETEQSGKRTDEGTVLGIDVSSAQMEIDWQAVKADGVEFVILRCGYRGCSQGYLVEDRCFKSNIEGAKKAGLGVGVYFFSQATNPTEAVEEASAALELCRGYKLEYPVFIAVEGAEGKGRADAMDPRERTDVVKAFCETVESAGLNAGVYAGRVWFNEKLIDGELTDYVHWLAEYRDKPLYTGNYSLWQYSSRGSVKGVLSRVNMNILRDVGR